MVFEDTVLFRIVSEVSGSVKFRPPDKDSRAAVTIHQIIFGFTVFEN